jgi:hypothetical protein
MWGPGEPFDLIGTGPFRAAWLWREDHDAGGRFNPGGRHRQAGRGMAPVAPNGLDSAAPHWAEKGCRVPADRQPGGAPGARSRKERKWKLEGMG